MKTINIRGKEYITVNERLKEFRNNFKDYSLTSEIIELGSDFCTMKATITDNNGIIRATGYAREVVAKSPINKYAFVENCETSAMGRALGNFGIGIDNAICTADELLFKLAQEEKKITDEQIARLQNLGADMVNVARAFKVNSVRDLTFEQAEKAIKKKEQQANA